MGTTATPTQHHHSSSITARLGRELGLPSCTESQLRQLAELGLLASCIAHEVNNALTPVVAYVDAALASSSDQELVRKALSRTQAGSQRACGIARLILELGRASRGSTWNSPSATPVHRVVEAVLTECDPILRATGVTVSSAGEAGCEVAMAPTALHQVLLNIVLNAVHAMTSQGGTLTIRVRNESGQAVIEVTDTGHGMDAGQMEHLFRPFAGRGSLSGSGLGLAICERLVSAAGGRIRLDSAVGVGTTVTLELPPADNRAGAAAA